MKKLILSFFISVFVLSIAYSQERSMLLFEYDTSPAHNNIEVYLNLKDEKINTEKPFTYYDKKNNKQEIAEKNVPKDLRLKLKKNKKINNYSYFIVSKGIKEIKLSANYSENSNFTTLFFKHEKQWFIIERLHLYYKDDKEKKLDFTRAICRRFATRDLKVFEFKK